MFGGCLILAFVSAAAGLNVEIPQKEYEVARGDNVTLPCKFTPAVDKLPLIIVSWSTLPDKAGALTTAVATYYYPSKALDVTPKFEKRVTMTMDMATKTANLLLTGVTLLENKIFECDVKIPGDDTGTLSAKTKLTVLVAPSNPICKVEGKTEYGQDIALTCMSEEGSPDPTYDWKRYSVQNQPAPFPPKATQAEGRLSLVNISMETSGYYICTSANKIRSATCNMTLSVLPPSMNIGSTAGIIGGCVAALLVLVIIVYCCCCRKKKDKEGALEEAEYHAGVPLKNEDGNHDDRPISPGDSMGGDRSPRGGIEPDEVHSERSYGRRSEYDERRERSDDRRDDYDDRRDIRDDRRDDYDDRRDKYSDRRDRDPDRPDRYDDRRDDYDDRRDDRRDDYDDRRDRYADRRDRESDRD